VDKLEGGQMEGLFGSQNLFMCLSTPWLNLLNSRFHTSIHLSHIQVYVGFCELLKPICQNAPVVTMDISLWLAN
jgi:hypothetical protein